VKAAQFLFEIAGGYRGTDVEFERRREDARRHGPVPTLEFASDDAVEVHDPGRESGGEYDACNKECEAPPRRPGAGHAGISRSRRDVTKNPLWVFAPW
jgi:hypothetical protein